jgi:hypothetical protein
MEAIMKIITIDQLIDKHYDEMFEWLTRDYGDDIHELLIEVKVATDGKTIRRSWLDRDSMLTKEEHA